MFKDKIGVGEQIKKGEAVRLNFGCGKETRDKYINIDILDLEEVDIVADLEKGLEFLPNNSVDEIVSTSFFEHIENLDLLMQEVHRVLKPGGLLKVYVPHFSNPYYFSDHSHKRFFGYYTFFYYSSDQTKNKRKVPSFYGNPQFEINSIKLHFVSIFPVFGKLKKMFGLVINSSTILQEFYEGHLSNIISCYGIEVNLRKQKQE